MDGTASFEMSLSHDDVPVKWMFKGAELKPSDRCKILRERKAHKLILQNVDSSNAGEYTAVAGHLQSSATLTVEGQYRRRRLPGKDQNQPVRSSVCSPADRQSHEGRLGGRDPGGHVRV